MSLTEEQPKNITWAEKESVVLTQSYNEQKIIKILFVDTKVQIIYTMAF